MSIKKTGIILGACVAVVYGAFLTVPFCINGIVNSYSDKISSLVEESCGLKLKLENLKVVTTPKLTVGVKAGKINVSLPTGDEVVSAENAGATVSLLPVLIGRVEADVVKADKVSINLKVQKDGRFLIEDYIPEQKDDEVSTPLTGLPLGLKLSNHLPNVKIKQYDVALVNMRNNKVYSVDGNDLKVTDFILNKKVKVSTNGSVKLEDDTPFTYDVKILNKIMPNIDLNDIVFAQNKADEEESVNNSQLPIAFNIMDILDGVKKNQLGASLKADVKTFGSLDDINLNGDVDVENLTLAVNGKKLPEGYVKTSFHGKKALMDVSLYTAENEKTTLVSEYRGGRSKKINIAFKSNAQINNIFNIIKSVSSSFNYNDLDSLTATGAIDADFNVKSNMKSLTSDGYFKIPSATINYPLYKVAINNINADADFSNDTVNLKNLGFTIFSQPLKVYGTIKADAETDMHLTADKLLIKGLVAAAGQVGLLKENDFKSGTLSMDTSIKGKLSDIKPIVNLTVNNLNILNKPSSTSLKLDKADVNLTSDGKDYKGKVSSQNIKVINPAATVVLPKANITLDQKDVDIDDTYLLLDNSKINISGKISDYTTKKIAMNIKAKGALIANDLKNMVPSEMRSMLSAKGSLPLLVTITGNDKKQIVDAQVLATPNGYLHVLDVKSIAGRNSILRSNIVIDNNNLKLSNTGMYLTGRNSLSENVGVSGLMPIVEVDGGVNNLNNPQLKGLKVSTPNIQTVSIPGYKNSKASVKASVTLSGNPLNPTIKGSAVLPEISIPTMKTALKNVTVDLNGKTTDINLPLITVADSTMNAKAVLSNNFANGLVVKNVDFNANLIDVDTLTAAFVTGGGSGSSGTASSSGSANSNMGIVIQKGKGAVTKFKTGKIVATDITSDFGLKNNVFYLKDMKANAFSGKVIGDINCNIVSGATSVDIKGDNMNAVSAIEATAGIPNALSGVLNFGAKLKLNAFAPNYNAMLKSVAGDVSFNIKDGHYANIGTLDQLLLAQNLAKNIILKAALAPIRNMPVVQNASNFKTITGNLIIKNGNAKLTSVKSAGPSMAYYVTGNYNLISGYTNVVVLGRLGADVVVALGPLGQLSANKLTSYIPKFGTQTANILNALTTNPNGEKTEQIPALTGTNSNAKDFKVIFVGAVTSPSSIRSFKWLSTCDTSEITGGTMKEQLKTGVQTIKQTGKNNVQDVKNTVNEVKDAAKNTAADVKQQVQRTKDSIQDLKNLKNMFKKPSSSTGAEAVQSTTTAPAATTTTTAE